MAGTLARDSAGSDKSAPRPLRAWRSGTTLVLALLAACDPADYRPPVDERVSGARGPIGVVTLPIPVVVSPELPVDPATKAEAAKQGAAVGGAASAGSLGGAGVGVIASAPATLGAGPAGALVGGAMVVVGLGMIAAGVILAPLAALIGAGAGWSRAQDDAERAASLAALERALAEWAPGPQIAAAFIAAAPAGRVLMCAGEVGCLGPDGARPEVLLVIQPQLPRIAAEGSIDPDLILSLQLDALWRNAADGKVLQRRTWTAAGFPIAFSEMAAENAAALRSQMHQLTHQLAAAMAADSLPVAAPGP